MKANRTLRGLIFCLWLLVLVFPGSYAAHAQELKIEAESFQFDKKNNRYTYTDAKLTLGELRILAGSLLIDVNTGQIEALAPVKLYNRTLNGEASRLVMETEYSTGVLENAKLFDSATGYYLDAETVNINADGTLTALNCGITTCPPGVTGWRVNAAKVVMHPGNIAVATNTTLEMGGVPVVWLPVFAWPIANQRKTGFLAPELSLESSSTPRLDLGVRLKIPYFINLDVDNDLTLTPEIIQNRGLGLGLDYRYAFYENQTGALRMWGINERHTRDPIQEYDFLPPGEAASKDPTPKRYLLDWGQNQGLGHNQRMVLSYRHSSDGQIRREYDHLTESRPYKSHEASYTAMGEWGGLGITLLRQADYTLESLYATEKSHTDSDLRPELLPSISYRTEGNFLDGLPLNWGFLGNAVWFKTPLDISGQLNLAEPSLSLPLSLGGGVELRGRIARRYASYSQLQQYQVGGGTAPLPDADFAQNMGQLDLRATLARVYIQDADDDPQGITTNPKPASGTQHRLTPRLVYSTIQDMPQPHGNLVLAQQPALKLLELRLDNEFTSRIFADEATGETTRKDGTQTASTQINRGQASYHSWLRLNLIQPYDLLLTENAPAIVGPPLPTPGQTEPGQPLLPFRLEANLNLKDYSFNLGWNYHHQLKSTTENTVGFRGRFLPRTTLGMNYRYNRFTYFTPDNLLTPRTNTASFDGEVALGGALSFGFLGSLDLQSNPLPLGRRLNNRLVFLDYHPVCYKTRLSYQEVIGTAVENGTTSYYVDSRVLLTFNITSQGYAETNSMPLMLSP